MCPNFYVLLDTMNFQLWLPMYLHPSVHQHVNLSLEKKHESTLMNSETVDS